MHRVKNGAFTSYVINSEISEYSGQDKSFVTNLSYGSLRNYIYLEACLRPLLKRPDKLPNEVMNALIIASYEILIKETPRRAAVNEWVKIIKQKYGRLSGLANAVLRRVEDIELAENIRYSIPEWLYNNWLELFGEEIAINIAKGMLEPEPLWLISYNDNAQKELIAEACSVKAGPLENSLEIKPSKSLNKLKAFKKGYIQPQNPCSTIPVSLLEPKPNQRVLDLASGNGIKAAQIAATGADVVCVELDKRKLEASKKNLKRLGFSAEHISFDLTKLPAIEPASKVLLDAPCSGTGTLRGNPEIKLRLKPKDLVASAKLQKQMLNNAAQLTKKNGRLIYSVCAISKEETIDVVKEFLENSNFTIEDFETHLPHFKTDYGTFLLPYNGLDGFFIAKLKN